MQHESKKRRLEIFIGFITLIALVGIIIGKVYFRQTSNEILFLYGVSVTVVVLGTFLVSILKYKDPAFLAAKHRVKPEDMPLVSCIVAVYNEKRMILKCVDSMVNSSYKNKEVIVVNDCSIDGTKEILDKRYGNVSNVRLIHLPKNVGKKKALAQGMLVAKGELFMFTDSDSIVAPDAIQKIVNVFVHDKDVGAVCGHGRAYNAEENLLTKIQDSWYETQFSVEKAVESAYGSVSCLSGPLAVFRKAAIYNFIPAWENDSFLGGEFKFATDRQLTGYVLGAKYIGAKLKRKYKHSPFLAVDYPLRDWKAVYCRSAKVWTVVPNKMKKLIRQHVRWKKSFIRNLFFTGTFYWRKHPIVSAKYYLGAMFTIVGPFIAIRHLVYLPINGNLLTAVYYLAGILFVGALYGLAFKIEDPDSDVWIYRPFMSLLSTMLLSWLIFYSALTIRKKTWHRG